MTSAAQISTQVSPEKPFSYKAFGLRIASDLELPELERFSSDVFDLRVEWLESLTADSVADISPMPTADGRIVLSFARVAAFSIEPHERRVTVQPAEGAESVARLPLLGPVMAIWLHLDRRLVLHGSGVACGSGVVAFVGDKGAGKSTTAAASVLAGWPLVSDDLLVCGPTLTGWKAEATYAQLKLNPDAAEAIKLEQGDFLPSPHAHFYKRQVRLPVYKAEAIPFRALCVLERSDIFALNRRSSELGLAAVLRFAYVLRYAHLFVAGTDAVEHFSRCVAFAQAVPIFTLKVPSTLDQLSLAVSQLDTGLAQAGH